MPSDHPVSAVRRCLEVVSHADDLRHLLAGQPAHEVDHVNSAVVGHAVECHPGAPSFGHPPQNPMEVVALDGHDVAELAGINP